MSTDKTTEPTLRQVNEAIAKCAQEATTAWMTRKGQSEHVIPRPGKKPFQWRWMSLKEILGNRRKERS